MIPIYSIIIMHTYNSYIVFCYIKGGLRDVCIIPNHNKVSKTDNTSFITNDFKKKGTKTAIPFPSRRSLKTPLAHIRFKLRNTLYIIIVSIRFFYHFHSKLTLQTHTLHTLNTHPPVILLHTLPLW